MSTTTEIGIRELDHRQAEGIGVTLLWDSETNRVFVTVDDSRQGYSLELDIEPGDALDAFHHPFAYASRSRGDVYAHAA
jgi:hypothetical protein